MTKRYLFEFWEKSDNYFVLRFAVPADTLTECQAEMNKIFDPKNNKTASKNLLITLDKTFLIVRPFEESTCQVMGALVMGEQPLTKEPPNDKDLGRDKKHLRYMWN